MLPERMFRCNYGSDMGVANYLPLSICLQLILYFLVVRSNVKDSVGTALKLRPFSVKTNLPTNGLSTTLLSSSGPSSAYSCKSQKPFNKSIAYYQFLIDVSIIRGEQLNEQI